MTPDDTPRADDPRRAKLLEAAIAVFLRFGFRKTSMDEIARAADVSRQSLYLHFSNKEALLAAAVEHTLDAALAQATAALTDRFEPLERRLIEAMDTWVGRYVGLTGPGGVDLQEVATPVLDLIARREAAFSAQLEAAIIADPIGAAYRAVGVEPAAIAATLQATARGLKYSCQTRAEFVERIGVAAKLICTLRRA